MKAKLKTVFKIIAAIAFIVLVCLILLMIPGALAKVAGWTGTTTQKVKDTLVTVIGTGVGLMLVSFGVAAIALPVVAIPLIIIGVVFAAYSLWTSGWFGSGSGSKIPIDDKAKLNKIY